MKATTTSQVKDKIFYFLYPQSENFKEINSEDGGVIDVQPTVAEEYTHVEQEPIVRSCVATPLPAFLYCPSQKVCMML